MLKTSHEEQSERLPAGAPRKLAKGPTVRHRAAQPVASPVDEEAALRARIAEWAAPSLAAPAEPETRAPESGRHPHFAPK
jgi:hypothetical protein